MRTAIILSTLICITTLAPVAAAQRVYTKGVTAADHPLASEAGAEILLQGGNAVDAAVATSFALSVVRPQSCGVGGGGFMLVHMRDDPRNPGAGPFTVAINYRELAPAAVTPDYFERLKDPDASRWTGHAVAVPGTVFGLLHALERYGTMDRADVLAPAIKLAEQGFAVDAAYLEAARGLIEWFEEDHARAETNAFVWERFLNAGTLAIGHVIRNPEQAEALRLIAEHGGEAFTRGPLAEAIVEAAQSAGGALTLEDLRAFTVVESTPLQGEFMGRTVMAMPMPSSGGVATLQSLAAIERIMETRGVDPRAYGHNTGAYIHLLAEVFKHAFADRAHWLGDTDEAPVERLLSAEHVDAIASRIDLEKTHRIEHYGLAAAPPEDGGTSHISVVDAQGNAVACTETINLAFGSRIVVPGFGFCLNNEMDDFTTRRGGVNHFGLQQSDLNLPSPGKRPLSSMSPTIVLAPDGQVEIVVGGSGGPRIITAVVQSILNTMLFNMDAQESVAASRFHHQWRPNILAVEAAMDPEYAAHVGESMESVQRMLAEVPAAAARRQSIAEFGHRYGLAHDVGVVQLVRRHPAGEGFDAASDPRKGGLPAGFD